MTTFACTLHRGVHRGGTLPHYLVSQHTNQLTQHLAAQHRSCLGRNQVSDLFVRLSKTHVRSM